MDGIALGPVLNNVGVVSLCVLVMLGFVTDRIVSGKRLVRAEAAWDKRLLRAEQDRDRWQDIALQAMRASATAIVPAAEAVHAMVNALPDPGAETEDP